MIQNSIDLNENNQSNGQTCEGVGKSNAMGVESSVTNTAYNKFYVLLATDLTLFTVGTLPVRTFFNPFEHLWRTVQTTDGVSGHSA